MSYSIEKVFGGYAVSINNGNTVKTFYDVNEDIINIIKQLKEENKSLKLSTKDTYETSQEMISELQEKNHLLNGMNEKNYNNYCEMLNRWNKLKEWLEEEKPTDDMNENFIVIRLSDIKNKMKDLEGNDE